MKCIACLIESRSCSHIDCLLSGIVKRVPTLIMIPLCKGERGIIIEFKTRDVKKEKSLKTTCNNALKQIKKMRYASTLHSRGIAKNAIYSYGFGFDGKEVLITGGLIKK